MSFHYFVPWQNSSEVWRLETGRWTSDTDSYVPSDYPSPHSVNSLFPPKWTSAIVCEAHWVFPILRLLISRKMYENILYPIYFIYSQWFLQLNINSLGLLRREWLEVHDWIAWKQEGLWSMSVLVSVCQNVVNVFASFAYSRGKIRRPFLTCPLLLKAWTLYITPGAGFYT